MTPTTLLPTIDLSTVPPPRGPWLRGEAVTVEEHPTPDPAWSAYRLPGGTALVLAPSIAALGSPARAAAALWRAVANVTRVCPTCGARVRLGAVEHGGRTVDATMLHESVCPLSDGALAVLAAAPREPLPEGTPAVPRAWIVRPPRLAIRQRRRPRR